MLPTSRLFEGQPRSDELPHCLDLGNLYHGMDNLWQKSVREVHRGVVEEYAATIVLDAEGSLRLINEVRGDATSVTPNLDVGEGSRFVGTFHTHPYASGLTGMAFSGANIASAINNGEKLSLVQSGEDVFALVRTEKTPSTVNYVEVDHELNLLVEACVEAGMPIAEALFTANLDICEQYGLAFYWGKRFEALEEVYRP